jgi:RluA family pseudouridine synthase
MGSREVELQIDLGDRGARVDRFVAQRLSSLTRAFIQKLIRAGNVWVDGEVVRRPSQRLSLPGGGTPRRLVLRVDPAEAELPLSLEGRVLLQDAELFAVDKPSGYPVVAKLARAGEDVVGAARRLIGDVWPVHRLDAGTSGVLLLARTKRAAARLSESFAERRVRKSYLALVAHPPEPERGVVDASIQAAGDGQLPRLDLSGKPARTRYRTIGRVGGAWSVLLRPLTGRTHQIRLHMASVGSPLIGDAVHGGPLGDRLCLHARALCFVHPISGEPMRVTAPAPSWGVA